MKSLVGLEWANNNTQRNYPFTDSSTMIIGESGFIPNDLIVDARIYLRGTYGATSTPYVSQIDLELDKAVLYISADANLLGQVEIPWNVSANLQYVSAAEIKLASFAVKSSAILTGMVTVNVEMMHVLQSLGQGSYRLESNVMRFLPFVCEYLPGPQVTSANELTGPVTLRGEAGIQVKQLPNSDTDIEISIVGDPHFTRYNCLPGSSDAADALAELRSTFLEELLVVHYPSPTATNPVIRALKTRREGARRDGSIDMHSTAPLTAISGTRAFRIVVSGNTINFSLAGGNV
jgi:hypothetical protein